MTAVAERPAADVATPDVGELLEIPLEQLHESPLNPRTRFDVLYLNQLRDSLLQTGQITPVVVRPRKAGGYELGAGHCRYRAAKLAAAASPDGAKFRRLSRLLAVVRDLDDRAFVELLNIENLQRKNLHPLEEAQGFKTLMEKAGYDVKKIAARLGMSVEYVYSRLKLLQLVPAAKTLFLDGTITAGHAILLARLTAEEQNRVIDEERGGLFQGDEPDVDAEGHQLELEESDPAPVSVRKLADFINRNVRLDEQRVDDPILFPETVEQLHLARDQKITVVHISYDHQLREVARDPKRRTYGPMSWTRADGQPWKPNRYEKKTVLAKRCPHAVLGLIVAGEGRGEAFLVCVEKKKCEIHWPKPKKRRTSSTASSESNDERWKRQREREEKDRMAREARGARWEKALGAILEAVAAKVKTLPAGPKSPLAAVVLQALNIRTPNAMMPPAKTAEDLVRHMAFEILTDEANDHWMGPTDFPKRAKAFGVDVAKILNAVAPIEKAKAAKKAKK